MSYVCCALPATALQAQSGTPRAWCSAPTVQVQITEEPLGFSFLNLDADGCCVADTWHPMLAEAMDQAKREIGIEKADWISSAD